LCAKRPKWRHPPHAPILATLARSRRTKYLTRARWFHGDLVSRSQAYFPWPATKLGAELKKLRHSARSHRPWSVPRDQGLTGTLASNGGKQRRLRRSAGRPALRAVRNASGEHLPLLRRTAIGWRGCCFVSQPRYAQRTRRSRREWMVSSPSMRLKNAIGKTNPPAPRSARAQSGPSPDQRFAGNRAHGRSKCEGARSSALLFSARTRESAA
jgi:hypothetical protein